MLCLVTLPVIVNPCLAPYHGSTDQDEGIRSHSVAAVVR